MPRLIVVKGADEGKSFDLNQPVLGIGRDATNIVRLHDTEVSRRHAEFRINNGECRLIDVGSANGTFVNNQPVKEAVLKVGDHVQIGQSILVYSAGRTDGKDSNLANRISIVTPGDDELPSAIIKTVTPAEGSRLLAQPDQAETEWLRTSLANLGVMYETIQAVSHILDLDHLLARIMELIFKSIEADRGCIMLGDGSPGNLEPKAVRWRDETNAQNEKIPVSRTIMEYVLREKQGVLVSDALQDERFNTGMSIVKYGIREVICVPMKGRHDTLGVLYLDTYSHLRDLITNNSPAGKFTADHLTLAVAIAHQAALAVEETRYHHAMVQAERLAAVGQTIAAVSHHIKNILQGLRSGSEILKMGLGEKDDELVQQGWRIVDKNQGRIFELVMDMLSYSKEREPAIEDTDINRVVLDIVELLAGRAKEIGASLETRLDEELPLVQADPEGLHRALLNVVSNALDAVEKRQRPQVGIITALDSEPGWVRISVLDNGVGIRPNQLADVFKPFVSSKGSKGTGLGLPVSRKIMREHGGDLIVQSQPGRGSRFVFTLPIQSPLSQGSSGTSQQIPVFKLPTENGEEH